MTSRWALVASLLSVHVGLVVTSPGWKRALEFESLFARTPCNTTGEVIFYRPDYSEFVEHMIGAIRRAPYHYMDVYGLRGGLACASSSGLWLEFGVFKGNTIQRIARVIGNRTAGHNETVIYGFDSFQGLPEAWRVSTPTLTYKYLRYGAFNIGGRPPFKATERIKWVIGLFNATLTPFLDAHASQPVSMVHIDSDLYSAASYVLRTLDERGLLRSGVVLIFDELFNFPGFERHEILALWELLREDRTLGVQLIGTSTLDVKSLDSHMTGDTWPQACAMRIVRLQEPPIFTPPPIPSGKDKLTARRRRHRGRVR